MQNWRKRAQQEKSVTSATGNATMNTRRKAKTKAFASFVKEFFYSKIWD
jgi:hypothetical protein